MHLCKTLRNGAVVRISFLALALGGLTPAHASDPNSWNDWDDSLTEAGHDIRAFEMIDPAAGQYSFSTMKLSGVIDHATNKIYAHTSNGRSLEIAISADLLLQAGITRTDFSSLLTNTGNGYETRYDRNRNSLMDDWGGDESLQCRYTLCSPWKPNYSGDSGLPYFDRWTFGDEPTRPPTDAERIAACDRVEELSKKGTVEATVTGVSCAAAETGVGILGCGGGLVKLAITTHQRNKNQKICKHGQDR